MKGPDPDRERSEKILTQKAFLTSYNEGVPPGFPSATAPLLKIFKSTHPHFFKHGSEWSLDQHRKRLMDWLPAYVRKNATEEA